MIKATVQYLKQTKSYLKQISPAKYTQPIEQMSNSTIGKHTRHFLECYQCLINQHAKGAVCYDSRARNLVLETDPDYALQVLESIVEKINTFDPRQSLILHTTLPTEMPIHTSINRELLHNYEHTTHHLALIRVGLNLLNAEVQLPETFGIANATLLHQQKMVLND